MKAWLRALTFSSASEAEVDVTDLPLDQKSSEEVYWETLWKATKDMPLGFEGGFEGWVGVCVGGVSHGLFRPRN